MAWPAHGDADPAPPADASRRSVVAAGAAGRAARERLRLDGLRRRRPRRAAAPGRHSGSVFDVCHAGVVLRALLFVHAAVGVGVAFEARSIRRLARARRDRIEHRIAQRAALAADRVRAQSTARRDAARCAMGRCDRTRCACQRRHHGARRLLDDVGHAGRRPVGLGRLRLAGAAFAAALFQWLHLRAKATLPAETAARLAELQSRIRPHFLFNTLNTALALVRLDPPRPKACSRTWPSCSGSRSPTAARP
jgi:two-component system sensor histidine kinase AlgZ